MADKWDSFNLNINGIKTVVNPVLNVLDQGISKVNAAVNLLENIMKILQMYVSAFGSLSTLLATFVNYAKNSIKNFGKDIGNTGVYLNVFVPPAFVPDQNGNVDMTKLASGGFEEFVQSLKVSLNNISDVNCPQFSEGAVVGGCIFMVDSETLDGFYRGVKFLKDNFRLTDIIPVNTAPLPPVGLRSYIGYFDQPDGSKKLGVRLEWSPPSVRGFTHYRITRSQTPGGTNETLRPVPDKLFGPRGHEEQGLIKAFPIRIYEKQWPPVPQLVYKDPDGTKPEYQFNGGQPLVILANPVTGKGSFIDYNIDKDNNIKYYYVVQSGFGGVNLWSSYSAEIGVPTFPKNCVPTNQSGVAQHKSNTGSTGIHLISVGEKLGQWTSIKVSEVVPFLKPMLETINTLVNSIAGSLKTNAKSFADFIKGISDRFDVYRSYIQAVLDMIMALENIFTGVNLGFLNLPPKSGGTAHFISRIVNAQRPPEGFTGPEGITCGVAIVYGKYKDVDASGKKTDLDKQWQDLEKAFAAIEKLLT